MNYFWNSIFTKPTEVPPPNNNKKESKPIKETSDGTKNKSKEPITPTSTPTTSKEPETPVSTPVSTPGAKKSSLTNPVVENTDVPVSRFQYGGKTPPSPARTEGIFARASLDPVATGEYHPRRKKSTSARKERSMNTERESKDSKNEKENVNFVEHVRRASTPSPFIFRRKKPVEKIDEVKTEFERIDAKISPAVTGVETNKKCMNQMAKLEEPKQRRRRSEAMERQIQAGIPVCQYAEELKTQDEGADVELPVENHKKDGVRERPRIVKRRSKSSLNRGNSPTPHVQDKAEHQAFHKTPPPTTRPPSPIISPRPPGLIPSPSCTALRLSPDREPMPESAPSSTRSAPTAYPIPSASSTSSTRSAPTAYPISSMSAPSSTRSAPTAYPILTRITPSLYISPPGVHSQYVGKEMEAPSEPDKDELDKTEETSLSIRKSKKNTSTSGSSE